jgi:choline dehydrogenase
LLGRLTGDSRIRAPGRIAQAAPGKPVNAAKAYLNPAAARGNVEVVTDALATRILFEGARAIGLEFLKDDVLHEVRASRR